MLFDKKSYCELCKNPFCSDTGRRNIHFMDHNHCSRFMDSIVPEGFVLVPGGKFMMGNEDQIKTQPIHEVTIKPFYMKKYLVTVEEYYTYTGGLLWANKYQNLPITKVTHQDAKDYAKSVGGRLPTEAEWEYACQATDHTQFNNLGDYAWDGGNSNDIQEVGQKLPNDLGLYDMLGNVGEWCEDTWHKNYYGAPTDGSAWLDGNEDEDDGYYVVRGGSFRSNQDLSFYYRHGVIGFGYIGIRVVKDL